MQKYDFDKSFSTQNGSKQNGTIRKDCFLVVIEKLPYLCSVNL